MGSFKNSLMVLGSCFELVTNAWTARGANIHEYFIVCMNFSKSLSSMECGKYYEHGHGEVHVLELGNLDSTELELWAITNILHPGQVEAATEPTESFMIHGKSLPLVKSGQMEHVFHESTASYAYQIFSGERVQLLVVHQPVGSPVQESRPNLSCAE
jgi:hypothetical protein